ncbi:uncharacterized protein A1O5_10492 [Cladophialophora psammophila CBS 110553]|uniref:Uncharacterized protein n=1 Tax=Cladophialophora psammophila CBS 110553 TaxID=1182543 RepID=W9WMZ2_9EURO|nr:uncharacterized protein A1O5_10492 [Cladophialophora psammophila CBS 110553]EXJ66340.1 hypothetical protein A1O5_10492 [Cladophialophora psammophila CBS 110553]
MWPFKFSQDDDKDNLRVLSKEPPLPTLPPKSERKMETKEEDALVRFTGWPNERLSIPLILRAPTLMLASFACGFSLGASQGATKGAYRYRAENAHRLPTTQTGWFLYQKSKNYHAMLGGIKEGVRFGSICTGWATLFMVTEEMVDLSRARLFARGDDDVATGQRDFGSTVIAGMTLAGIYSWKRGLDHFAAARTARSALRLSLAYGLVQDLAASLRGSPPAYVSWLKRKISG